MPEEFLPHLWKTPLDTSGPGRSTHLRSCFMHRAAPLLPHHHSSSISTLTHNRSHRQALCHSPPPPPQTMLPPSPCASVTSHHIHSSPLRWRQETTLSNVSTLPWPVATAALLLCCPLLPRAHDRRCLRQIRRPAQRQGPALANETFQLGLYSDTRHTVPPTQHQDNLHLQELSQGSNRQAALTSPRTRTGTLSGTMGPVLEHLSTPLSASPSP